MSDNRFNLGNKALERLIKYLETKGCIVAKTGQENWLPKSFHNLIRYKNDSKTAILIRYFPDLVVFFKNNLFLVEAKSIYPKYYDSENFSIEKNSLLLDN